MRHILVSLLLTCFSISTNAQAKCACCEKEYRQFDFWTGHWETFDPSGKLVGTNTIDIIQDSCILRENWKSATSPYTGTSYNFYDSNTSMWTQTWIDNQGGALILKGSYHNNKMILSSEPIKNNDANSVFNKITWTNNKDGTVRQLWESKTGDGEWSVLFDGTYKKVDGEN